MRKKYYFNGKNIIYGRKLFGMIRGIIISTAKPNFYIGEKIKVDNKTYTLISKEDADRLKDWGGLS